MIIQDFDNGWGPEFPAKQLENLLLEATYQQLEKSQRRFVVINSVWYTGDYHKSVVLPYLENNSVDAVVLVSMLDAAIPQPDWFSQHAPVLTIGYYPGSVAVDYWAMFLSRHFQSPHLTEMARADKIDRPFMCLNRKPHWHRVRLYNQLKAAELTHAGIVSLGGDNADPVQALADDVGTINLAPNSGPEQTGIPNDISSLGTIANWQSCFFNVVTETVYDINTQYFVSEKIYKPILGLRPFTVYTPDGGAKWLTDRGFETYHSDFADITDLDISSPGNVVLFLAALSEQPKSYWQMKFLKLKEKILYNRYHFDKYVDRMYKKTKSGLLDDLD